MAVNPMTANAFHRPTSSYHMVHLPPATSMIWSTQRNIANCIDRRWIRDLHSRNRHRRSPTEEGRALVLTDWHVWHGWKWIFLKGFMQLTPQKNRVLRTLYLQKQEQRFFGFILSLFFRPSLSDLHQHVYLQFYMFIYNY